LEPGDAMMDRRQIKSELSLGRIVGDSPADARYYVLVLFDISSQKKYRILMKTIRRYCSRIQKSVFEAYLRPAQIKELTNAIERTMCSELFYDPNDSVRIYRMSGSCAATTFGTHKSEIVEENIFL
jgi:CRISPR-associated protein Cas2